MEEKLHRRWVKIGGKKGSIFDGNFHMLYSSGFLRSLEVAYHLQGAGNRYFLH